MFRSYRVLGAFTLLFAAAFPSVALAADSIKVSWDGQSPSGGPNGRIKGSGPNEVTGNPIVTDARIVLTPVPGNPGPGATIHPVTILTDPVTGKKTFTFNKTGLNPGTYDITYTIKWTDSAGVQQPDVVLKGAATARP